MAFLTISQAQAASRSVRESRGGANAELRKSAAADESIEFDIFVSHSFEDARTVRGVKVLLENLGARVYVDWIVDPQADRGKVTPDTADMLRARMGHSRFMLYATSEASPRSKWMPWELGYFDGLHRGSVGVLPLVEYEGQGFRGQEYLGLYPAYELIDFAGGGGRHIARRVGINKAATLISDITRSATRS